jgi:pimeloyl-ACP methyl ester carboxylesterase
MGTITSKDGTSISFQKTGEAGAPVILVHGTGASSARWKPVLAGLSQGRQVYAMDRRGHGASGDSTAYSLEREFEDIAALVDSLGRPVDLIGHSFGGICSVEASLLTRNIRRLILYEPPIPVPGFHIYSSGDLARLEAMAAKNDREGILQAFFRGYVRLPEREFEILRAAPAWPSRIAAAHAIPRDLRAHENYVFRPERFREMKIPVLLMLGGASPDFFKAAIDVLHSALANSRVVVLPEQQHVAMDTAPELFVKEAAAFLEK